MYKKNALVTVSLHGKTVTGAIMSRFGLSQYVVMLSTGHFETLPAAALKPVDFFQ